MGNMPVLIKPNIPYSNSSNQFGLKLVVLQPSKSYTQDLTG
jgi:hypothetical protein